MLEHIGLGITRYHLLDSLDRSRDNKQQELTSLILETPLPTRIAVIGYTGQCDTVGKLIVQHDIKEVTRILRCEKKKLIAITVLRRQKKKKS